MVNVIFNTAFIGDLILTIPLIRLTRNRWPDQRIILVCRPGLREYFLKNSLVDVVIEIDKSKTESIQNCKKELNSYKINNLFCAHQSFHSAWILRDVKASLKISYKNIWSSIFFHKTIKRKLNLPEAARLLDLASPLFEDIQLLISSMLRESKYQNSKSLDEVKFQFDEIPAILQSNLAIPSVEVDLVLSRFGIVQPFVVLGPSSQWPTKRWKQKGFAQIAERFVNENKNVYLIGSSSEIPICDSVIENVSKDKLPKIISLAGKTSLFELQVLISSSQLVVCNDSGPMHMAAAVNTPLVALFGPTTLELGYRPWSDQSAVVQKNLKCRPCGKHGHKKCPISTHACMEEITSEDVFNSARELLSRQELI